jgi:hypothetical protein
MAQNTTITLTAGAWTQLTDADISSITFQNTGGYHMLVKGTATATAPTDATGAIRYNPGQGERNVSLSDLFPGISAARVYAYSDDAVSVMVSHG